MTSEIEKKKRELLTERDIENYLKQLFGNEDEPILFKMLIDDAWEKGKIEGVSLAQKEFLDLIDKLMSDDRKVITEDGNLVWWVSFVRIREELKKAVEK